MAILDECCCGLDGHAKTMGACLLKQDQKARRTCSPLTDDVLHWSDWLVQEGCPHVAIERTGVSWKPVFTILAGLMAVSLANARHVQAVPGHKPDARESAWWADL